MSNSDIKKLKRIRGFLLSTFDELASLDIDDGDPFDDELGAVYELVLEAMNKADAVYTEVIS